MRSVGLFALTGNPVNSENSIPITAHFPMGAEICLSACWVLDVQCTQFVVRNLHFRLRKEQMPVSAAVAESNRVQTGRLRKLVQRLDPSMLAVCLPGEWTA